MVVGPSFTFSKLMRSEEGEKNRQNSKDIRICNIVFRGDVVDGAEYGAVGVPNGLDGGALCRGTDRSDPGKRAEHRGEAATRGSLKMETKFSKRKKGRKSGVLFFEDLPPPSQGYCKRMLRSPFVSSLRAGLPLP